MSIKKEILKLVLLVWMVLFGFNVHAQEIFIMPLGNSITVGKGDPDTNPGSVYTGFRDDLYVLLTNNSWNFDFVGSQSDGNPAQFDVHHEGHSGWKADEIDVYVDLWLSSYNPDIVLLHIGTNDISSGESLESTILEIESIVDKIYNFNQGAALLLCTIVPRIPGVQNEHIKTQQLNDLIEQLYASKNSQGYNIYLVDQYNTFVQNPNWATSYMFDAIHPNNVGYNVMAQTFWEVLQTVVLPSDDYYLTVAANPAGSGTVQKSPDKQTYNYGDTVQLTAVAYGDYRFDHWSGDINPDGINPRDITITKDRTIYANFVNDTGEYISVPSQPAGPSSGISGQELTFTTGGAVNTQGHSVEYQFDWGDGLESGWGSSTNNHIFYASGSYEVSARARCTTHTNILSSWSNVYTVTITGEDRYILTINVNPGGGGSVTINPDKELYEYNESVVLLANPANGYFFNYWDGDIQQRSDNPTYIQMAKNRTINANFQSESGDEVVSVPDTPIGPSTGSIGLNLSFSTGGSASSKGNEVEYQFDWGDGNSSSWGGGTQTYSYSSNGTFQVKAQARSKPNPGVISGWSGSLSVLIEYVSVTYTLTINTNPNGAGSVTKLPDKSAYAEGETVQLTAAGNNGGGQLADKVYLEGEGAVLSGSFEVSDDPDASANQYIYSTSNQPKSGVAEYSFEVLEEGTYVIWGRCYALSGIQDSFYMVVDQSPDTLTWHLNSVYNTWIWQTVSHVSVEQEFYLTAGAHQVSLISRDRSARLDKLILSKDTSFQPSGKELSPNQSYAFDYWSGDLSGTTNPETIVINSDKVVTANFEVVNENITTPTTPIGLTSGRIGETLNYTSGSASSDLGHNVEYQFDWGDGSQSGWSFAAGSHQYASEGNFEIKVRARCETHTNIVSAWSSSLVVSITLFTGYTLDIEISPAGAGSVSKDPFRSEYDEDEWVEIKAIPYRSDNNIRLEAESGKFVGQMSTGASTEASGGKYIYSTTNNPQDGSVEFTFNVMEAGTYTIWGRCFALSNTEDSFFMEVDGSPSLMIWHLDNTYNTWIWQKVSDNHVTQEFYFNAGQHSLKVVKRDKNVQLDKLLLTNDPSYVPEGKEETMELRIEAESGILESPITTGNDPQASGGQYIYGATGDPQDGSASYTFQIHEAGIYVIWGRCYALSGIEDSFFIQVDGNQNLILWHLETNYDSWIWQKVTDNEVFQEFYFDVGQHSLDIIKRENNVRLDKIIITKDPLFQPQGKEDGAAPDVNYRFDHWSGDISGNSNPVDILMIGSKVITAHFVEADHIVSSPTSITGPSTATVGELLSFSTSGAISSLGHNVEYQFNWGDGNSSGWSNGTSNYIYYALDTMFVKSRARSETDTSVVSSWSESMTVTVSGFTLTVSVDPANAGVVSKNPNQTEYGFNESVTLTAEASTGYSFGNWSGNLSGKNNPATIVMDANKTVTAIFGEATEIVSKPTSLTGPESGIMGQVVAFLTAGAVSSEGHDIQYQFDWGDGIKSEWSSGSDAHIYYAIGVMQVKARARCKDHTSIITDWTDPHNISLDGYAITIGVSPQNSGNVSKNPNKTKYASGENVNLFAIATNGYEFDYWSGDVTGDTNPVLLTTNGNKQVEAYFVKTQESVSAPQFISGPDTGNVEQSMSYTTGGSINNLGNPIEYQFDWGDSTLSEWKDSTNTHVYQSYGLRNVKARARSKINNSVVSDWTDTTLQVTVLSNYFRVAIVVDPPGTGSVNLTPPKSEYEAGDVVILSPLPTYGYIFHSWSGDLTGPENPAILTIDGNLNLTAHFEVIQSVQEEKQIIPDKFELRQNYPNPFNPETLIGYQLAKESHVKIKIYNLQGQIIDTLIDEIQPAGYYKTKWLAIDNSGNNVPSGVYLCRMVTEHYFDVKKMILMK